MLTLVFIFLMFCVFGKLLFFSFKAAWGITKILLTFIFLPVILIGLVFGGFLSIALPILVVIGIVSWIAR